MNYKCQDSKIIQQMLYNKCR